MTPRRFPFLANLENLIIGKLRIRRIQILTVINQSIILLLFLSTFLISQLNSFYNLSRYKQLLHCSTFASLLFFFFLSSFSSSLLLLLFLTFIPSFFFSLLYFTTSTPFLHIPRYQYVKASIKRLRKFNVPSWLGTFIYCR